ncbi:MAG: O-antigen ligase family protein [Abditibacteriota bacterium]|nr:O-antigen ligase family protein [Abditibacteriota bacterium]
MEFLTYLLLITYLSVRFYFDGKDKKLLLLFILFIVSVFIRYNTLTLGYIMTLTFGVVVYLGFCFNNKIIKIIPYLFIVVSLYYAYNIFMFYDKSQRLDFLFLQPNFLGDAISCLCLFFFWYILWVKNNIYRCFVILIYVCLLFGLVATQSRGACLGFAVALLLSFIYGFVKNRKQNYFASQNVIFNENHKSPPSVSVETATPHFASQNRGTHLADLLSKGEMSSQKPYWGQMILLFALTVILFLSFMFLVQSGWRDRFDMSYKDTQVSTLNRVELYKKSCLIIAHNPLGVGAGKFTFELDNYNPKFLNHEGFTTCLNSYLTLGAEFGVHTLVLFLLIIIYLFYKSFKAIGDDYIKLGLLACVVSLLIFGLFTTNINRVYFEFLLFGCFAVLNNTDYR